MNHDPSRWTHSQVAQKLKTAANRSESSPSLELRERVLTAISHTPQEPLLRVRPGRNKRVVPAVAAALLVAVPLGFLILKHRILPGPALTSVADSSFSAPTAADTPPDAVPTESPPSDPVFQVVDATLLREIDLIKQDFSAAAEFIAAPMLRPLNVLPVSLGR